eukprot:929976_1
MGGVIGTPKAITYAIANAQFDSMWRLSKLYRPKTSSEAAAAEKREEPSETLPEWVKAFDALLRDNLGSDYEHYLDFLVEVHPITVTDANAETMNDIYEKYIQNHAVGIVSITEDGRIRGDKMTQSELYCFNHCDWKGYRKGRDRTRGDVENPVGLHPVCNKGSPVMKSTTDVDKRGGDRKNGVWKHAESEVINTVSHSFKDWKEKPTFKTFLEANRVEIQMVLPDLFEAPSKAAHSDRQYQLLLDEPHSYSYGYNDYHGVDSSPLPITGDSNQYFDGLMMGGLFGGGAMILIMVVFCMGLAIGMAIYRSCMQPTELDKENDEEDSSL